MTPKKSDVFYVFDSIGKEQNYVNAVERIWTILSGKKKNLSINIAEAKSTLIYMTLDLLGTGRDSDIVLSAWGLLKGYEETINLTARRKLYLEERERYAPEYIKKAPFSSLSENNKNKKANDQHKPEIVVFRKLNQALCSIESIDEYLKKASLAFVDQNLDRFSKEAVMYPSPSYIIDSQRRVIPLSGTKSAETFGLPYANDWFCGRDDKLSEIRDNYNNGHRLQLLCGMGGMGKTQIALKYVYNNLSDYSLIHWVKGNDFESIAEDYRIFLKSKRLLPDEMSTESIYQSYTKYMDSHSGWLIIYDNCDFYTDSEYDAFKKLCLPKNPSTGNILITSRNNRKIGDSKPIDVHTMSLSDSKLFLLKRTGTDDDSIAELLARRLGCFPLAMEIAAAYISATPGCTIEKYLYYINSNSEILDKMVEVTDYNNTIKEVITLTLDRIKKDLTDKSLADMVEIFVFLAAYSDPKEIGFNLYAFIPTKYADFKKSPAMEELQRALVKDEKWDEFYRFACCCRSFESRDEISRIIVRYGLMKPKGYNLTMHYLQQEIIRRQIATDEFWLNATVFSLGISMEIFSGLYRNELRKAQEDENEEYSGLSEEELRFNQFLDFSKILGNESEKYINNAKNQSSIFKNERCFTRFSITLEELYVFYVGLKPEIAKSLTGVFLHHILYGMLLFTKMNRIQYATAVQQLAIDSICLCIDRYGNDYVRDINEDPFLNQISKKENIDIIEPYFYYLCMCLAISADDYYPRDYSDENISRYENALVLIQSYNNKHGKADEYRYEEKSLLSYIKYLKNLRQ